MDKFAKTLRTLCGNSSMEILTSPEDSDILFIFSKILVFPEDLT